MMNTKLMALAKQAGFPEGHMDPRSANHSQKCELQKFAELIIKECMSIIEEDDGATHRDELMFEHFGVE